MFVVEYFDDDTRTLGEFAAMRMIRRLLFCICFLTTGMGSSHAVEPGDPCVGADQCEDFDSRPLGLGIVNSENWIVDNATILVVNSFGNDNALLMQGPGGTYFANGRQVAYNHSNASEIRLDLDLRHLSRLNMSRATDRIDIGFTDSYFGQNEFCCHFLSSSLIIDLNRDSDDVTVRMLAVSKDDFIESLPSTFSVADTFHISIRVDLQQKRATSYFNNVLLGTIELASLPDGGTHYHEPEFRLDGGETAILQMDNLELRALGGSRQYDLLSKFSNEDPRLTSYRVKVGENLQVSTSPELPDGTDWELQFLVDDVETPYTLRGKGAAELARTKASYPIANQAFKLAIKVDNGLWAHRREFRAECVTVTSVVTAAAKTAEDCDGDTLSNEAESWGRGIDINNDGIYDFEPAREGADIGIPTIFVEFDVEEDIALLELSDRVRTLAANGLADSTLRLPRDFPDDIFWAVKRSFADNRLQLIVDWDATDEISSATLADVFSGFDVAVDVADAASAASLFDNLWSNVDIDSGAGNCLGAFGSAVDRAADNCLERMQARESVSRRFLIASNLDGNTRSGVSVGPYSLVNIVSDINNTVSGLKRAALSSAELTSSDAGTLMHELGHTFGLLHGGNDRVSCKPNYPSVMNYLYQDTFLSGGRSLLYSYGAVGEFDEGNAVESSSAFYTFGFPIIELRFDTSSGLFRPGRANRFAFAGVDWDGDGVERDNYVLNYNTHFGTLCDAGDPVGQQTVMLDHNDWAALNLNTSTAGSPAMQPGADVFAVQSLVASTDTDNDGVIYSMDNCAIVENANQLDSDGDGFGDACDSCPFIPDSLRADLDLDGQGDACDVTPGSASRVAPSGDWLQISLPANAFGATVAEVFGTFLDPDTYSLKWVLFSYNANSNSYTEVPANQVLSAGVGYWFIQATGSPIELALSPVLSAAELDNTGSCELDSSCVVTPGLFTDGLLPDRVSWAMVGNPYSEPYAMNDADLLINSNGSSESRRLVDGASDGFNSPLIFSYNGAADDYDEYDEGSELPPWVGGWVGMQRVVDPSVSDVRVRF